MNTFEILCVTMHQKDFSKVNEMNIHSNVVFANQTDTTSFEKVLIDGQHEAKMISTKTRGVGINRNLCLMYASSDICLLADDDVKYYDGIEEIILKEYEKNKDADIIIFQFNSNSNIRKHYIEDSSHKLHWWSSKGWGGVHISFRRKSIQKSNIWFTTLFGGGSMFPSGEDSIWINEAIDKGLKIYISKEIIGILDFSYSSWFTGFNEKYYWGVGVCNRAIHKKTFWLYYLYFAIKTRKHKEVSFFKKICLLFKGGKDFQNF